MAQPYIGEVRMFAGTFAPESWAFCDGQILPISEFDTLFSLIGTTYGGDGETTFALPDLRGRVPVHQGGGLTLGESAGVEEVTLTTQNLPVHNHTVIASNTVSTQTSPANLLLAQSSAANLYITDVGVAPLAVPTLKATGGNGPHTNVQPYLCLSFIIALYGLYPSQA